MNIKLSAIMVRPVMPLRMIPPKELEVFSRVLFQYFVGVDEQHTKRWRRWWGRAFHREEQLHFFPVIGRHGAFHAFHMALERELFAHQDHFEPHQFNAFRDWIKTGAAFGAFEQQAGQLVFQPGSIGYEECSDDEMREFHENALAFLRTPQALEKLWPAMTPADRATTLELLIEGEDVVPPPTNPEKP